MKWQDRTGQDMNMEKRIEYVQFVVCTLHTNEIENRSWSSWIHRFYTLFSSFFFVWNVVQLNWKQISSKLNWIYACDWAIGIDFFIEQFNCQNILVAESISIITLIWKFTSKPVELQIKIIVSRMQVFSAIFRIWNVFFFCNIKTWASFLCCHIRYFCSCFESVQCSNKVCILIMHIAHTESQ